MLKTSAYAAPAAGQPFSPYEIERREPGAEDLLIEITHCGVCHSDIHQVRDEWGGAVFPMVPGHEIIGRVKQVGAEVTRFRVGDRVGVGCFVDSCRRCTACRRGHEQHCEAGTAFTYNGTEMDRSTRTYGGYSAQITVAAPYVLRIPGGLDPAGAAPLLCAGITTYSPLKQWNVQPGQHVGVVGLGGLGHMAVKLAAKMGAEVTVLSSSRDKEADALRLGATSFASTREADSFTRLRGRFDLIIDTLSVNHDLGAYLGLLKSFGVLVIVGLPPDAQALDLGALIVGNKRLAGSLIGGIPETQEMLDFCGAHGIVADVERIRLAQIDEAYERMLRSDVRYRFVIEM